METTNANENVVFNWLTYEVPSGEDRDRNPWITITSNDQRQVRYKLWHFKNGKSRRKAKQPTQTYVEEIIRPDQPWEKFSYIRPNNDEWDEMHVSRRSRPDNRFIQLDYYRPGNNNVGGENRGWPQYHRNPVMLLKEPVGTDATPIITYRFFYDTSIGYGGLLNRDGFTDVRDAYNHKTLYHFSQKERLTSISRFEGRSNHQLTSVERFFWGAEGQPDHTLLLMKSLETASGTSLKMVSFEYDHRGNVLTEKLFGNLTGTNTIQPQRDVNGRPIHNGCECYVKRNTHSQCEMNLLLSEQDDRRLILYSYQPGTNLLSRKLTCENDQIRLREFYSYDANAVQTKKIIDDGISEDPNDLTGISQRMITYTSPRTEYPIGLPQVVEERGLDVATGTERLIRKIVNFHNAQGKLVQQDHYGSDDDYAYSLFWEYDEQGNTIKEVDALGQVVNMRYDANKNLIYTQGPSGEYHTELSYDCMNRLIKQEEILTDGTRWTQTYAYDYVGNRIASSDRSGNLTHYVFDAQKREIERIDPIVNNEEGNAIRPTIRRAYDEMGNVIAETDARGNTTFRAYTVYGKPYLVRYPDDTEEHFVHDIFGNEIKSVAKNGSYIIKTLDYQGRVTKKEEFSPSHHLLRTEYTEYSAFNLMREVDAAGGTRGFKYDWAGRLSEVLDREKRTCYFYDSLGRLTETRDYFGLDEDEYVATIQVCDLLNRVIQHTVSSPTTGVTFKEEYAYDADGNRTLVVLFNDAGIGYERKTYDPLGNVVSQTNPDDGQTTTHYNFSYQSALGQRVKAVHVIDPLGRSTLTIYDALDRPVSTSHRDSVFGPIAQSYALFYDAVGNKSRRVDTNILSGQAVTTRWTYNAVNAVTSIQEDLAEKLTRFVYNQAAQLEQIIKPNQSTIRYEYDALNRRSRFLADDQSFDYVYTYDSLDNIIAVKDQIQGTTTSRSYNANNLLIDETLGNNLKLSFCYDRLGRLIQTVLPDQSEILYRYRGAMVGEVVRISRTCKQLYNHVQTDYDLSGRLLKATLAGAAGQMNYHYDLMKRPTEVLSSQWAESTRTYDLAGHLVSRNVQDSLGTVHCNYEYDALYQLISESGLANNSYQYDSLYNRVSKNEQQYTVNTINQLCDDGQISYRYHPNGTLESKENTDRKISLAYDLNDRLVSIKNEDWWLQFTYDAFNRRLSKQRYVKGNQEWKLQNTESYFYLHQLEIGQCDQTGAIQALKVMAVDPHCQKGRTVAIETAGQAFAAIQDASGSIVSLVDLATGFTAQNYRYSAFGEELNDTNTPLSPWRLAGMRTDKETGLVYFGERYYDPIAGRWITPDPLGFQDGPNLYAYVSNSPLTWLDYMGLFADTQDVSMQWHAIGVEIETVKQAGFFQTAIPACVEAFHDPHTAAIEVGGHIIHFTNCVCDIGGARLGGSSSQFNTDRYGRMVGMTTGLAAQGFIVAVGGVTTGSLMLRLGKEAANHFCSVARASWKKFRGNAESTTHESPTSTRAPETSTQSPAQTEALATDSTKECRPLGSKEDRFRGDPDAVGAHTQFRVNKEGGVKYATFEPETNPQCPNKWKCVKRFDSTDLSSEGHHNKATGKKIPEPHVHDNCPGGVRPALPHEIPNFRGNK